MLGGYGAHLGPWKGHAADLGGHLVARRAAESQHEQPEAEKCRILVDVAQKLSNEFWRKGGKGWQVLMGSAERAGPGFASQNAEVFRF